MIRSSIAEFVRKVTFLHEPEDHYLNANFVLCHSLLRICMHIRIKKFAMFQQNYMIVLEMADNLGVSVLLI